MGFITLLILTTPAPDGVAGTPHPIFPKMFVGAEKGQGQAQVLGVLPLALMISILGFVGGLIHLGIPESKRDRFVQVYFGVAVLIQIGVVTSFWYGYEAASLKGWSSMIASFPVPTAIFLYCLYPALCLYGVLYVVKFRTYVLPPETEADFAALVEEMKAIPEDER